MDKNKDIVKRLEDAADEWCFDEPVRLFLEAADEIIRLRDEIERLQQALQTSKHECAMADDAVQHLQALLQFNELLRKKNL